MAGNQKAQKILYDKYKKIVKDFISKKYSLYHDLDDDVSEIMIKVIMGINTFDNTKSKFKSWVFSITKNHMIDMWRCNTASFTSINSIGSYTISNDCLTLNNNGCYVTTDTTLSINNSPTHNSFTTTCGTDIEFENCSSVNYISEQLSPKDFTLLDMKYVQGYDYGEIGKEFNVTSSTISNRVNYIKTKLKKNNSEIIYE